MSSEETPSVIIQEGTAWGLGFSVTDKTGSPETPTAITYTIHDDSSGGKISEGTVTPLAADYEITLDADANTLQNRNKTTAIHALTVKNVYNDDPKDTLVIVYRWKIKRTKFL